MKHRTTCAILAALMLLTTMTACGSRKETSEPMLVGEGVSGKSDAAPDAAPDAVYEAAPEAADDAVAGVAAGAAAGADGGADGGAVKDGARRSDTPKTSGSPMAVDGDAYSGDAEMAAGAAYSAEAGGFAEGDIAYEDYPVPSPSPVIIDEPPVNDSDRIGQLTAGEWRDHQNWGFFSNLVNSDLISFPSFGLDPTQRIAVTVTDAAGAPAANTKVELLGEGNTLIWTAVTGKDGVAYLFETNGRKAEGVTVAGSGEAVSLPPVEGEQQGNTPKCSDRSVTLTVGGSPAALPNTQIMFIVDTTGSMGDEMLYLQSDFTAIADEVGDASTEYAALFYKDESDFYVTRYEGFTQDTNVIKERLNAEVADGGGDEPEAVAQAFTEAFVNETNWREDAVKIAFLIYDAPPHDDKDAELQTAIEQAAAKGIHLVPVVSSNGSRETELFGRACAICTNGSYVFLTDDSGIGGSHLEPIIGDYEVEKLHDIIVRIIQDYKQG